MTRGSHRRDMPLPPATGWIDYDAPVETWEYWGRRFGQELSPKVRTKIALTLFDFKSYCKTFNNPRRLDRKKLGRMLRAAASSGKINNPDFGRWLASHSLDYSDASTSEKAVRIMEEFTKDADDFLMVRPMPEPLFTGVFYDLFREYGMNVSLGSAGDLSALGKKSGERNVLESPFIEFVRRCVWGEEWSVPFCQRVQAIIKRHRARPKP